MAEYETMIYQRKGKIGYIMFNRPQSLNAVNGQVEIDLAEAFLEFDTDDDAWVCILHGTGRCFCAGADIKQQFVAMTPLQAAAQARGRSAERYLGRSINWKPVIAAIHGYALGAGISIAIECDLIVASEEAQFGITETKRGLTGGGVWAKLNAFMPSKVVTEMLLTGEPVSAQEMYRLGFINRLVPTGQHLEAAEELAEKVLKAPPLACRAGVRLTRRQWVQPVADADLYGQPLNLHLSEDFKESGKSFVEKRAPIYHAH
jgi:enoyl-CoA hydratase/carnithine racemase